MQLRLQAAGIRPISNIVDVTNYVLLELGQPMHAFDLARLTGAEIRVRTARAGEQLRTLDAQTRSLSPEMLVIADAKAPVAIAGVMGGADSEVTSVTRAIVLESAYFNPLSVRRTSKKLGLKTEASMRFERGTDPAMPGVAMKRALALLETISAGAYGGMLVDQHPTTAVPVVLTLRRDKIRGLLGHAVPDADVQRILQGLGFALQPAAAGWTVTVPTWRVDAVREVDLIEEVARHYGFDRLPTTFPVLGAAPRPIDPRISRARQLRNVLTGAGFSEAVPCYDRRHCRALSTPCHTIAAASSAMCDCSRSARVSRGHRASGAASRAHGRVWPRRNIGAAAGAMSTSSISKGWWSVSVRWLASPSRPHPGKSPG
jgi:phenylalanyl-tRNA synthetase beta chain